MTVRKQILIIFIAFAVVPTLFLSTLRGGMILSTIENLHINRLNAITHTSAAAFSEIVGLRKYEVSLLASSWNVIDFINAIKRHGIYSSEAMKLQAPLEDYFDVYVNTLGTFDDLVLLDASGKIIVAYNRKTMGRDLSSTDYFQRVVSQLDPNYVFISKVHDYLTAPENLGIRSLALSKAFRGEDGELLGVLVAYVDTSIVAEFTKSISFGETGLAFVMDSDNYILYHPEARFFNSYTSAPQLSNLSERYQNGEIPVSGLINDLMDGRRRIYYYEIMEDSELVLILRQDYQEFTADRDATIYAAVISSLIALLIAFFVSYKYARYFVKPIEILKRAFASGEREESYIVLDMPNKNEFGELAKSYNTMIQKLESQYELLKKEKEKNEYNAMHDWVTGLNNRVAFQKFFSNLIAVEQAVGVCFIDIDNFKRINDLYGHPIGDSFLVQLAKRIKESGASFDLCARLGGDEFAVAKIGTMNDIQKAVNALFDDLKKPIEIGDLVLYTSVSLGISHYPEHGHSVDTLLTNADIAMHTAKSEGKNTYAMYNVEMRRAIDKHNSIIQILRNCVDSNEAFLMYQPIYETSQKRVVGFEALMRIKSEEMGLISPLEFIPIAETDKDIMLPIGQWVLREACTFLKNIVLDKHFEGYVSVNISIQQLNSETFVDDVVSVLKEIGVSPKQLQLEFTENIIMSNLEVFSKKLIALRELGILITLDDFITKTSSLYNLSQLPVDSIKIDSSFISGMDLDEKVAFMNRTIVELAHRFDLKILAEGVETQKEYDLLKSLSCDYMQGFLFSRPLMKENARKIM